MPALAATGSATPVAAASPPPSPTQTQLFGVHPALEGRTTLPGGHFNFALVPGQSITDGVVIENFSDHSIDFHVYGADLHSASGGGVAPAQATDIMHEAGAWIVVSTPRLVIPAHSRFTDLFTVGLPLTVSPGQHLGAVVAAAGVATSSQGSAIEVRTALIAVITVPGVASPSATLGPLTSSDDATHQIGFEINLTNTGNLLLTYVGSVEILDGAGRRVARLPLKPLGGYVVPAGRSTLAATWTRAIPRSGNYIARARVAILAEGRPVATLTSQSLALRLSSAPAPGPALAIALGAAIVLLATWLVVVRLRRRRQKVTGAPGELMPTPT